MSKVGSHAFSKPIYSSHITKESRNTFLWFHKIKCNFKDSKENQIPQSNTFILTTHRNWHEIIYHISKNKMRTILALMKTIEKSNTAMNVNPKKNFFSQISINCQFDALIAVGWLENLNEQCTTQKQFKKKGGKGIRLFQRMWPRLARLTCVPQGLVFGRYSWFQN